MTYQYKILISFHQDDVSLSNSIYNLLKKYIDEKQIFLDGKDWYNASILWTESLRNALRNAEYIVICIGNKTLDNIVPKSFTNWYYEQIENILRSLNEEDRKRIIPVTDFNIQIDENKFPMLCNCKVNNYETDNGRFLLVKILQLSDSEINNDRQYVIDKIFQLLYGVANKKNCNKYNIRHDRNFLGQRGLHSTRKYYSYDYFTTFDDIFQKQKQKKLEEAKRDRIHTWGCLGFVIILNIFIIYLSEHC